MPKLAGHLLGSVEVHRSPLKHVDFDKSFPVTADLKVKGQRLNGGREAEQHCLHRPIMVTPVAAYKNAVWLLLWFKCEHYKLYVGNSIFSII